MPPLWSAAAELRGACVAALDGPAAAMSASLRFGPAFAVVASGVDAAGAAAPPKMSHGGWSDDGDAETLVFHAGGDVPAVPGAAAAAAAADDDDDESRRRRPHVGVLTLRRGVPERAMSLRVDKGRDVVDARAYTEARSSITLVPIRPRPRGERRSLRTFPGAFRSAFHSLAFNPDAPPSTPFDSV